MYYIKTDNIITYTSNNLYETLKHFNIVLSDLFNIDTKNETILYDVKSDDICRVKYQNKILIISSDDHLHDNTNSVKLNKNDLDLFPFFVLHKDIILKLTNDDINNFKKADSKIFLDIITHEACLLDPYQVLMQIFDVNEEMIYQMFIMYLNCTVKMASDVTPVTYDIIIRNFFNYSNIVMPKYNNLFKYYSASKKIYPFMLDYKKYISKFNNNNDNN